MEAFETSNAVTVDGYSYLQDNPAPKPPPTIIRAPKNKTSLLPLLIGIVVLVVGFSLDKVDSRYFAHYAAAQKRDCVTVTFCDGGFGTNRCSACLAG